MGRKPSVTERFWSGNFRLVERDRDLERMYSFGRRHPYNPFWGGFVIESPRTGTFKRFPKPRYWF